VKKPSIPHILIRFKDKNNITKVTTKMEELYEKQAKQDENLSKLADNSKTREWTGVP